MDPLLDDLARAPAEALAVTDATGAWTYRELRDAVAAIRKPGPVLHLAAHPRRETVAMLLAGRAHGAMVVPRDPRRAEPVLAPEPAAAWAVATGGTTGAGRWVALSAGGVAAVTDGVQAVAPYVATDRVLSTLPLWHTYGLSQLWLCLRAGAALHLLPSPLLPGELALQAPSATVLPAVPGTFRALLSTGARPALRLVTLAGQDTPLADRSAFSAALSGTDFVHFYGLTEATTRVLWLDPRRFCEDETGAPIPGVDALLAEDGELVVRGPNVALGYLGNPLATRARFGAGDLRTGDLFRRTAAGFRFLGRRDGSFKRFGELVVPEQVEAALASHPEVAEARVSRDPGVEPGVFAELVARGRPLALDELRRYARAHLPPAMVPTRVHWLPALPRTHAGKLRRSA